jgi:hypothetical protein
VLTFATAVQYFFFDEFNARLNHLALDYLTHPKELVGNVWQSYNVPLWLSVAAALGVALALLTSWMVRRKPAPPVAASGQRLRGRPRPPGHRLRPGGAARDPQRALGRPRHGRDRRERSGVALAGDPHRLPRLRSLLPHAARPGRPDPRRFHARLPGPGCPRGPAGGLRAGAPGCASVRRQGVGRRGAGGGEPGERVHRRARASRAAYQPGLRPLEQGRTAAHAARGHREPHRARPGGDALLVPAPSRGCHPQAGPVPGGGHPRPRVPRHRLPHHVRLRRLGRVRRHEGIHAGKRLPGLRGARRLPRATPSTPSGAWPTRSCWTRCWTSSWRRRPRETSCS